MRPITTYRRVIPRDLFNDAKLLKCLGQLALIIFNGKDEANSCPPTLEIDHDGQPFNIVQDPEDGGLRCDNVTVTINGRPIKMTTNYNSRDNWPLYADDTVPVFSEIGYGRLSKEFLEICQPATKDNDE